MVSRRACISRCGSYRYALWREWASTRPRVLFIGCNPSSADHRRDDPTVRRCMQFAHDWGYGSLSVGNLFAFRASAPRHLKQAAAPVGTANDRWLRRLVAEADLVVAAWGVHGQYRARDVEVLRWLVTARCLGTTTTGAPRHPLYVRKDAQLRDL